MHDRRPGARTRERVVRAIPAWRPTQRSGVVAALVCASTLSLAAQAPQTPAPATQAPTPLPLGPARERGASITPAFEGWYQNPDGTYSLLIGYFNRNKSEALDIPVGPNNRIEPGPADQGQPTHFETGREWGVFVIKVPKDFGTKLLTWTIVSNGESQSIPFGITKGYTIEPFQESGMGNKPPELTFTPGGPKFFGPPTATAATLTGTVGEPVTIGFSVEDPKEVKKGSDETAKRTAGLVSNLSFHKFRGPGEVKFDPATINVKTQGEAVSTKATFSLPGEYLLRVQANDDSGEGGAGFQCCWTNAYVKVTVK